MTRFGRGDWRLEEWRSEPVRYRVDLRVSVKLTVRASEIRSGRTAEKRFFAKVYADRNQVVRAWNVQQELGVALRKASEPFALAPLVTHLPDERVLVQEEVEAVSLQPIIRKADPGSAAEAVRRAARAVAALHCLPMTAPGHRIELDRTDPERLRRSAANLRNVRPDLTTAVAEIETQILAGLDSIDNTLSVPAHGDLKPLHLLIEEERVVLLDVDKFAAGEPMLDVMSSLLPLRRARKSDPSDSFLARDFAEEYFAHVPAAWEQRLAPHYAWAILAEASAVAVTQAKNRSGATSSGPEGRKRNVDTIVEEARALLAGGV